jgi:glycosyltransferase involved in cell wall biosynthesis
MKIAHIAPPWIAVPPKDYGGTETVIHTLVEEQVTQGNDVTLIASGDSETRAKLISFYPRALREEDIPWSEHEKEYSYLRRALAYVQEHDFDIVHTHLSSGGDLFLFPLLAPLNKPHVTTLHSKLPFDESEIPKELRGGKYEEWAAYVPIIAISESTRNQQGLPLNFIGVVHHGIDLHEYSVDNLEHDDYFFWLGRFVPEKGAHLAIEAARQANVPLILAGTIDKKNKETEAYFYEQIEPEIDDKHIYYRGPVDIPSKIRLMSRARGFLNPIQWEEPFGMVMIEAMALGCPVIAFARGAAPEIILPGQTGFLAQDIVEMVQYIQRIDEIDREEVRAHVQREFSATAMAHKYTEVYQRAILLRAEGVTPTLAHEP